MNREDLKEILRLHSLWLGSHPDGVRADLRGADLREANLREANLRGADLREADLSEADLSGADLREADLSAAYLRGADLSGADLREADLSGADLREANLSEANLREADLSAAYLRGAALYGAKLYGADLSGASLPDFQIVPDKGSFTAWKKLRYGLIAELRVPANAKRTGSLVGRKCRVSRAKVVNIYNASRVEEALRYGDSQWCNITVYRVGEIIKPDSYDDDIRVECTHGIHCFITRKEAEDY